MIMREIKFRSWSTSYKCMRNSEDDWWIGIEINSGKTVCIVEGKIKDAPKEIIIMQYTGLKDRNGKEIYEGDIVKGNFLLNYKVFFEKGEYKIGIDSIYKYLQDLEIIGNIYENPELIK